MSADFHLFQRSCEILSTDRDTDPTQPNSIQKQINTLRNAAFSRKKVEEIIELRKLCDELQDRINGTIRTMNYCYSGWQTRPPKSWVARERRDKYTTIAGSVVFVIGASIAAMDPSRLFTAAAIMVGGATAVETAALLIAKMEAQAVFDYRHEVLRQRRDLANEVRKLSVVQDLRNQLNALAPTNPIRSITQLQAEVLDFKRSKTTKPPKQGLYQLESPNKPPREGVVVQLRGRTKTTRPPTIL